MDLLDLAGITGLIDGHDISITVGLRTRCARLSEYYIEVSFCPRAMSVENIQAGVMIYSLG